MSEATFKEIIDDLARDVSESVVTAAVSLIEIELSDPDVLDSKIACDALRRAIANIRKMKR